MSTLTIGTVVNVDMIGHCKVTRINGDVITLKEVIAPAAPLKGEHERPVQWCEKRIVTQPSMAR